MRGDLVLFLYTIHHTIQLYTQVCTNELSSKFLDHSIIPVWNVVIFEHYNILPCIIDINYNYYIELIKYCGCLYFYSMRPIPVWMWL